MKIRNGWLDDDDYPLLPNLTVDSRDEEPALIYDHTGQPYMRYKPPMGFIDPMRMPTAPEKRSQPVRGTRRNKPIRC